MSRRDSRNVVVLLLCFALVGLGVGLSSFQESIKITGSSKEVSSNWKIGITNISVCTLSDQLKNSKCMAVTGDAENVNGETYIDNVDSLKAIFTSKLYNVGDSITYKVIVTNEGNLSAKLSSIKFDNNANETLPVIFSYIDINENEIIKAGESKTFYIMVNYLENSIIYNNIVTNTLDLTFVQAN